MHRCAAQVVEIGEMVGQRLAGRMKYVELQLDKMILRPLESDGLDFLGHHTDGGAALAHEEKAVQICNEVALGLHMCNSELRRHISPYLPISPHVSPHLPTSPYISLHLPTYN